MALLEADQSTNRELRDIAAAITGFDPDFGPPCAEVGQTVGFSEMESIISHFLQARGYQSDDIDPTDTCYRYVEPVDPGATLELKAREAVDGPEVGL
jgi:hypothetical protein